MARNSGREIIEVESGDVHNPTEAHSLIKRAEHLPVGGFLAEWGASGHLLQPIHEESPKWHRKAELQNFGPEEPVCLSTCDRKEYSEGAEISKSRAVRPVQGGYRLGLGAELRRRPTEWYLKGLRCLLVPEIWGDELGRGIPSNFAMTRVLVKQERRKQKEYFEKKRLKSKMKLLGVLSPAKNSTVSLDLLNLYIVNQISCKKEISETVRKPIHVNLNRDIKMPFRKHDLELPVSPNCVPSKLCLDDTESNVYYQRLGSKEELAPVQTSKVMDSCSVFESQVNKIENCRFSPPSFSPELSSNSQTKHNFTTRIVPNPWEVAYENKQNEQLSNGNYSRSMLPKLNESQAALNSSYNTAECGTLFGSLNSPGNGNFLTERSTVIMDEDGGSRNERRESDFITVKEIVQPYWGQNGKTILNCLENVNQAIPSTLPENCDSFVSQNMINLLNLDQQRIKENNDSTRDICAVPGSNRNYSTNRCIRNIFTVPGLPFSNSACNEASYPEKCQLNKNCLKEYNNSERNYMSTSFEKHCYPASSEKTGNYENNYQKKIPQKIIQKYPTNNMGNISLEELHSEQSWNIGLQEILMEERKTCILKERPASKKMYFDSSQSSQSTNYSPRQTESSFSSSSDMSSEDEDQILQKSEDSNRRFIETKEPANTAYLNKVTQLPDDRIIKNNTKISKQNENSHPFSMKNNTDKFSQCHCNSAYILQNKTNNSCILHVAKCDAWVQTENEQAVEEKLDAAIQCDIFSECKCRNDVSFLSYVEGCSENIKADTTGGQEILKNN
ncbi:PREDICTED: uncharacterized protein C12orf40 homolog [Chrysochloris asiatica]|uniref:Uncharacterized protein C12orf40 homolog n=1 Tax=Chrysochloris asiatica TaxID=185453 RepID=A0A9B0TK91_CHRAS|nr:PREDICTED: uncharacterized protein C12orf40 homolog [Chrysochloris asiatica]